MKTIAFIFLLFLFCGCGEDSILNCNKVGSSDERICIFNYEDTVRGYNKLIFTPYRGGQFYFFQDSIAIRVVSLNYVEYMEEK